MPDELIEADWEEGRVFVGNADTIARPLRLGVDEAVTLVVGLRALREVPGLGERDAVDRALAKLEDAAGAAAAPARRVRAEVADGRLARAAGRGPSRRSPTTGGCTCATSCPAATRPPSATSTRCGSSAWTGAGTSRAGATAPRTPGCSGIDRIEELTVLDVDGTPPAGARERDLSEGTFRPAPDDLVVTLRLLPGATWVADYYPVESVQDVPACRRGRAAGARCARPTPRGCAGWCGGSAGGGTVLDPPEVVAEIRDGAAAALTAYPATAGEG